MRRTSASSLGSKGAAEDAATATRSASELAREWDEEPRPPLRDAESARRGAAAAAAVADTMPSATRTMTERDGSADAVEACEDA